MFSGIALLPRLLLGLLAGLSILSLANGAVTTAMMTHRQDGLIVEHRKIGMRRECHCPGQEIAVHIGNRETFYECQGCKLPSYSPVKKIRGSLVRTCYEEDDREHCSYHSNWGMAYISSQDCPICSVPYADLVIGSKVVKATNTTTEMCVCKAIWVEDLDALMYPKR